MKAHWVLKEMKKVCHFNFDYLLFYVFFCFLFFVFHREGRIGDPIASDLADMLTLYGKEETAPSTTTSQQGPSRGELLQDAYEHLSSIRHIYMVYFGSAKHALAKSRYDNMILNFVNF